MRNGTWHEDGPIMKLAEKIEPPDQLPTFSYPGDNDVYSTTTVKTVRAFPGMTMTVTTVSHAELGKGIAGKGMMGPHSGLDHNIANCWWSPHWPDAQARLVTASRVCASSSYVGFLTAKRFHSKAQGQRR